MKAVNYESIVKSMTDERDLYLKPDAIKRRVEAGAMSPLGAIREYMLYACHCYKNIYISQHQLAIDLGINENSLRCIISRLEKMGELWQEKNDTVTTDNNGVKLTAKLWRLKGNTSSGIFCNDKTVSSIRKYNRSNCAKRQSLNCANAQSVVQNDNSIVQNDNRNDQKIVQNDNSIVQNDNGKNAIQQASVEPSVVFEGGNRVLYKSITNLKENRIDGCAGQSNSIIKEIRNQLKDGEPKVGVPLTREQANKALFEDVDYIRKMNKRRNGVI